LNVTLADDDMVTYAMGVRVPPIVAGRRALSDTVGMPVGAVAESVAVSVALPAVVAGIVTLAPMPPVIVSNDAVAGPVVLTASVFVDVVDPPPPPVGGVVELPPPPPQAESKVAATTPATTRRTDFNENTPTGSLRQRNRTRPDKAATTHARGVRTADPATYHGKLRVR
jgi:hypothetical protein